MAKTQLDAWWKRQRAERVAKAQTHVIGDAASRLAGADAERAQSFEIATAVRQWFDSGYDPANMIRMLISGACFIADNTGVSREQLIKAIQMAKLAEERQLILKPDGA